MNNEKLIEFIENFGKACYSAGKSEGIVGDANDNSNAFCKVGENKLLEAILEDKD